MDQCPGTATSLVENIIDFKPGRLEIKVYLSVDADGWGSSLREREAVMLAIMQAAEETGVPLASTKAPLSA